MMYRMCLSGKRGSIHRLLICLWRMGHRKMKEKINKKDLVERITQRTGRPHAEVESLVDATLEEIYEALKREESVSLRNFGVFYINNRRSGVVFKFNPAQRLRALFGWSSTYKGDL